MTISSTDRRPAGPSKRSPVPDSVGAATFFGWIFIVCGVIAGGVVGADTADHTHGTEPVAFLSAAAPFFGTVVFGLLLILVGQIVRFLALIHREMQDANTANATPETKTPD